MVSIVDTHRKVKKTKSRPYAQRDLCYVVNLFSYISAPINDVFSKSIQRHEHEDIPSANDTSNVKWKVLYCLTDFIACWLCEDSRYL